MKKAVGAKHAAEKLRLFAEQRLSSKLDSLPAQELDQKRLLHELQVHKIELELQIEALTEARTLAEESLALAVRVQESYVELFDFAPMAYFTIGRDGVILALNFRAEQLLGLARSQISGQSFSHYVDPEFRSVFRRFLLNAFSGGERRCELSLHSGKQRRWVSIEAAVDASEQTCLAAVLDITEQKRHQQDAELATTIYLAKFSAMSDNNESDRALLVAREVSEENLKRALLAEKKISGISEETRRQIGQELHDDLGQHLTGLAFIVENLSHNLLLKQLPESQEAARITGLINEAIAKTRLLASQLYPLHSAEENLETRLAMLLQHIEATFGIACQLDCPKGLIHDPEVATNLYRIVQESVHNAVKHSGGDKITVRVYAQPSAIIMEIADNGLGLDVKRLSSTYNGLGMQIMQSRAALLGASLALHDLPSGGVKLLVTLPT